MPLTVLKSDIFDDAAPGADASPSPWLRHWLQGKIISLLQVMHAARYIEVEPSYKNCHINIYFKTKP